MSEYFHPSSTGSPDLPLPRLLATPLSIEAMRERNVVQARVMQRMLNLDSFAAQEVTSDSMKQMEAWGAAYHEIFRHFRDVALAGDIDEVVRLLEAARQKQSPSH